MTAKVLLDAISGIDDSYIEKFARKRAFRLGSPWGLIASAAALCMVIGSAVFLRHAGLLPAAPTEATEPSTTVTEPTTETTVPETKAPFVPGRYIYWNREGTGETEVTEDVGAGQLYIRDELRRAMEEFADEADVVFAVTVLELTGASRQEVYDQYISKLDVVHDEYLLRQVIFVNRQQLEAMEPHENFAIALKLRYASGECESVQIIGIGGRITKEEMKLAMNEIPDGIVEVKADLDEYSVHPDPGNLEFLRGEEYSAAVEKLYQDFLADYDLNEEEVTYSNITSMYTFTVEKDALWKLYEDYNRIFKLEAVYWGEEFYAAEEIDCVCIEREEQGKLVFWAEDASLNGNAPASLGEIVYSDGLLRALEYFEDEPNTVFAIRVLESTGAEYEDTYRGFIQKLNVKENYMEYGLIYATRQQLEQIQPSEKFAIVFRLAYKQDFDTTIHDIEDIARLVEDQYRLKVYMDVGNSDEYTEEQRNQRFDSILPGVLAAYGLTEEDTEILREDHAFVMTGNVDTITKLSSDPRVRWLQVLWHEDLFVVYPPEYAAKHPWVWVPEE